MEILLPFGPPPLFMSEHFNATTSLINFGLRPFQPIAQTNIVLCYPLGAGELSLNSVFTLTGSADNTGTRFTMEDSAGSPYFAFHGHSATNSRPIRQSVTNAIAYNAWNFAATTWDGSITATNIHLYSGINWAEATEVAYGATIDGTGTPLAGGASANFIVGNRGDAGRTFNGSIAYLARWRRVLTLDEVKRVQQHGPFAEPSGLIFCYANGRDYGPFGIQPVTKTAIGLRAPPNVYAPLGGWSQVVEITSAAASTQPPRSMHQFRLRAA